MASNYSCESITVLEGLEPVRKRPGMYIGDVHDTGLHHLLFGAIRYVTELHERGHVAQLRVDLSADGWVELEDDGLGLPLQLPGVFAGAGAFAACRKLSLAGAPRTILIQPEADEALEVGAGRVGPERPL